jgi:uncharacterized alkaline shock family protein YloU
MKVYVFLNVLHTISVKKVTENVSKSVQKAITSMMMIRLAELNVKISSAKHVIILQIYVSLAIQENFFMKVLV